METLFEGERYATPKPMNDKQLMALYDIADYRTWSKLLSKISFLLANRKSERRLFYNINEVKLIFEHLGAPIVKS